MKTILTIKTEHDGLMNAGFTNIKALFNFLKNELGVTGGETDDNLKYNYPNLVATIKEARSYKRFCVAVIYSNIGEIEIDEVTILSK